MNDPPRALFIAAQCLQPALLDRRFDRLIVDLIEIDDDSTLEIRLLTKRHVDKTEGVIVHGF
ncbi:MAG: hypothetical protein DMF37_10660 [Verrucomicrobia bacterium]|nr:MAG: hypothetical protein DMF37_10660 [Verrucomicrobiota bacterium]